MDLFKADGKLNPKRLKEIRDILGFTQSTCADLVKVEKITWLRWENGQTVPKTKAVLSNLKALDARARKVEEKEVVK